MADAAPQEDPRHDSFTPFSLRDGRIPETLGALSGQASDYSIGNIWGGPRNTPGMGFSATHVWLRQRGPDVHWAPVGPCRPGLVRMPFLPGSWTLPGSRFLADCGGGHGPAGWRPGRPASTWTTCLRAGTGWNFGQPLPQEKEPAQPVFARYQHDFSDLTRTACRHPDMHGHWYTWRDSENPGTWRPRTGPSPGSCRVGTGSAAGFRLGCCGGRRCGGLDRGRGPVRRDAVIHIEKAGRVQRWCTRRQPDDPGRSGHVFALVNREQGPGDEG